MNALPQNLLKDGSLVKEKLQRGHSYCLGPSTSLVHIATLANE